MENIAKKRPTSVTVIGWIFIAVAGLMILSGGMALMVFTFIKQSGNGIPAMPEDIAGPFRVMSIIFQYFDILASLQIVFAIFVMIASIQFLKLHAWARTTLEVVSWLGLAYTVGFGIFWVFSFISMSSGTQVAKGVHGLPSMFPVFGAIMGTVCMAVWAVPLIVIIKFLRGETIRESVARIQK